MHQTHELRLGQLATDPVDAGHRLVEALQRAPGDRQDCAWLEGDELHRRGGLGEEADVVGREIALGEEIAARRPIRDHRLRDEHASTDEGDLGADGASRPESLVGEHGPRHEGAEHRLERWWFERRDTGEDLRQERSIVH